MSCYLPPNLRHHKRDRECEPHRGLLQRPVESSDTENFDCTHHCLESAWPRMSVHAGEHLLVIESDAEMCVLGKVDSAEERDFNRIYGTLSDDFLPNTNVHNLPLNFENS